MSKIFAYKHGGEGGCGKTAFYTLSRPAPGKPLSDGLIITTSGTKSDDIGAIMCGSCGNGVLGLRVDNLKPARPVDIASLLISSINEQTVAKAEVYLVNDALRVMHELLSKIKAPDNAPPDMVYRGSKLEASVLELIGASDPEIIFP